MGIFGFGLVSCLLEDRNQSIKDTALPTLGRTEIMASSAFSARFRTNKDMSLPFMHAYVQCAGELCRGLDPGATFQHSCSASSFPK